MGRLGVIAVATVFALTAGASPAGALDNGLARTPPMGWNAFYSLGCHVDEGVVRETADALRSTGMADAGYRYVILDDCWMSHTRDAERRPAPAARPLSRTASPPWPTTCTPGG